MKLLLGRESLSHQLANIIEKDIFSGKLPPDRPLASARTVARNFGVSYQVVVSALDILEQKDLIVRLPRKGVFVKAHNVQSNAREILFFAFGEQVESHTILRAVNDLMLHSEPGKHYDYSTRIVSSCHSRTPERFDRELARLANLGFIDCAIIYNTGFSPEDIRKCRKLPYPVIFVGDMPNGDFSDLNYFQLAPDNEFSGRFVMEYVATGLYDETILAVSETSSRQHYTREVLASMERTAKALDVHLRQVLVPGETNEEMQENLRKIAPEIATRCAGRTLFLTFDLRSRDYQDLKILTPEAYPHIDLMTMDYPLENCRITYIRRNFTNFQEKLRELVDGTCGPVTEYRHLKTRFFDQVVPQMTQKTTQHGD